MKYKNSLSLILVFLLSTSFCFAQKNKKVVSGKYDFQGPYCNGLAKVKKNKKWGFIDSTGNVVVAPKYDEVENFKDGLARVRKTQHGQNGGGWGMINTQGQEIVKPMFDWIYDFEDGKAKVKSNGAEGYIDKNGNLVK